MMRLPILALLTLATACSQGPSPSGAAAAPKADEGMSLFDGKTLGSWTATDYGGQGPVSVVDGALKIEAGATLSGVHWTGGAPPRTDYELSLEAMKVEGSDFFCGIVFPVGKAHCSFVAGGWGGGVTGLSSVDHMNASENETSSDQNYAKNKWYAFRLRVTPANISVWLDGKPVITLELANRQISVHPAVESGQPLGLVTFQTTSLFRNIRLKKLGGETAAAERVTYEAAIRPLIEKRCGECHGPKSPTMEDFDKNKAAFKEKDLGPRYDTFEHLMVVVNGADLGALMRRLDDGKNTKDGKPGNMYKHLGEDEAWRGANLALLKRWVGGWTLKRKAEISPEERAAILAPRN